MHLFKKYPYIFLICTLAHILYIYISGQAYYWTHIPKLIIMNKMVSLMEMLIYANTLVQLYIYDLVTHNSYHISLGFPMLLNSGNSRNTCHNTI